MFKTDDRKCECRPKRGIRPAERSASLPLLPNVWAGAGGAASALWVACRVACPRAGGGRTLGLAQLGEMSRLPLGSSERHGADAVSGNGEAHIFIAFLAYCLHVTLARRLHALAPGLTPRSVLEKFAAVQMIDVHLPTTEWLGGQIELEFVQEKPQLGSGLGVAGEQ